MKLSIAGFLAVTASTFMCDGFTISRPVCLPSSNPSNTCAIRTQGVSYPVGHHHMKNICLFAAFESVEEIELDAEERMEKSRDQVMKNLTTIRTGRASANILDLVQVDYYGAPTPLNQLATISVPNSQQLSISPFDKSALKDIERAIVESDLGMTPNNDGTIIRLNIPPITEERRKELMKQCKALGEDGKVAIRNIRRDGVEAVKKMEKAGDVSEDASKGSQDTIQKLTDKFVEAVKKMEKAGDVSEDASKGSQDTIQKLTDKFVKAIDEIVAKKEKEVMTV